MLSSFIETQTAINCYSLGLAMATWHSMMAKVPNLSISYSSSRLFLGGVYIYSVIHVGGWAHLRHNLEAFLQRDGTPPTIIKGVGKPTSIHQKSQLITGKKSCQNSHGHRVRWVYISWGVGFSAWGLKSAIHGHSDVPASAARKWGADGNILGLELLVQKSMSSEKTCEFLMTELLTVVWWGGPLNSVWYYMIHFWQLTPLEN